MLVELKNIKYPWLNIQDLENILLNIIAFPQHSTLNISINMQYLNINYKYTKEVELA